jgi:hypothetical protein
MCDYVSMSKKKSWKVSFYWNILCGPIENVKNTHLGVLIYPWIWKSIWSDLIESFG